MDENERSEVTRSLRDLLTIAKVAMPAHLYEQDTRVIIAQRLLAKLQSSTTESTLPLPVWDITDGIDRFMSTADAPGTRSDAVAQMVREWLISNGYLDLPPEEPN